MDCSKLHSSVLVNIFELLGVEDLKNVFNVCTSWRNAISEYRLGYKLIQKLKTNMQNVAAYEEEEFQKFMSKENLTNLDGETLFTISIKLKRFVHSLHEFLEGVPYPYDNLYPQNIYRSFYLITDDLGFEPHFRIYYSELQADNCSETYSNFFSSSLKHYNFIQPKIYCIVTYSFENINEALVRTIFEELKPFRLFIIPGYYYLSRMFRITNGLLIYQIYETIYISVVSNNRCFFIKNFFHPNLKWKGIVIAYPWWTHKYLTEIVKFIVKILNEEEYKGIEKIYHFDIYEIYNTKNLLIKYLKEELPKYKFIDIRPQCDSNWEHTNIVIKEMTPDFTTELTQQEPFSCTLIDYLVGKFDKQ